MGDFEDIKRDESVTSWFCRERNREKEERVTRTTMADDGVQEFETAESGASLTYPAAAGSIRKGAHIVIKGRPCKVLEMTTSKTGKHGHAKCHFTATDIFTGKKCEMLESSTHNCDVPNVHRAEYTLLDIDDDGFVSLMEESGDTKDDLQLPSGTDDSNKLAEDLKAAFDDGKDVIVTVLSAMNEEMIIAMRESK